MHSPITIRMPIRTRSEANLSEHWAKRGRRAREQRQTALLFTRLALKKYKPTWYPVKGKLRITLTRIGVRKLDPDNLARSGKHVQDGVADALGVDDGDDRLEWKYAQKRGGVREYFVEVELREGGGRE